MIIVNERQKALIIYQDGKMVKNFHLAKEFFSIEKILQVNLLI